jgi:hypothetical protein
MSQRWVAGIWARAWSMTFTWSLPVNDPALPVRCITANPSPVLVRQADSGW